MSGCHASTVTRCDNRADFDACSCYGYSATGEPFDSCPVTAIVQRQETLSTSIVYRSSKKRWFPNQRRSFATEETAFWRG